ncbi:hypothetical protein Tco_1275939 [Tanacetum coccineum]
MLMILSQVDPSTVEPHISDDAHPDTPINATSKPTQGEQQPSGTTEVSNTFAIVFSAQLFGSAPSQFTQTPPPNRADKLQGTKRFADLKAAKDKSKEQLRRLTPTQRKAQEQRLTKIESQRVNKSTKIATMNITINNQPMNYKIFEDFRFKMLGFTKWLELHKLASRKQGAANDQLLKNLKAKFKWVRKRKRTNEVLIEVFVSEDVAVDGMHRKLNLPQGITSGRTGQVTKEPEAGILIDSEFAQDVYDELIWVVESRLDAVESRKIVEKNLEGLGMD